MNFQVNIGEQASVSEPVIPAPQLPEETLPPPPPENLAQDNDEEDTESAWDSDVREISFFGEIIFQRIVLISKINFNS